MLWKDFFDRSDEWYDGIDPSELIPTLEDMGPEDQICDVLENISKEDCRLLYERLVFFRTKLSPEETMHVIDCCSLSDEEIGSFLKLQMDQGMNVSKSDIWDFSEYVHVESTQVLLFKYCISTGIHFSPSDITEAMDYYPKAVISVMTDQAMADQEQFSEDTLETFCEFYYEDPYLLSICQYALDHGYTLSGNTLELFMEHLNDEGKYSLIMGAIEKGTMIPSKELIEISEHFYEEKYFISILRALMDRKIVFTGREVLDLMEHLFDWETSEQLVRYAFNTEVFFTEKECQDLEENVPTLELVSLINTYRQKKGYEITSDEDIPDDVLSAIELSDSEEKADQLILEAMKQGEYFTLDQYKDYEYAFSEEVKGKFLAYILDKGASLSVDETIEIVELGEDRPAAVIMVRALDRGLRFTMKQFWRIQEYLNDYMRGRLLENVLNGGERISKDDIREVIELCDEKMNARMLEKAISQGMTFTADEVVDFCESLEEKKDCDRLILYSLSRGTVLSPDQICDLSFSASEAVLTEAVKRIPRKLKRDELENLEGTVDQRLLLAIDKKQKTHVFDEDDYDDSYDYSDVGGKSNPLMTLLAVDFMLDELSGIKRPRGQKFNVGDHVRVRWRGQEGTIIDKHPGGYLVSLDGGRKVDSFREEDLERCF